MCEVYPRGGNEILKNKITPPLPRSRDSLPYGAKFEKVSVANGE